MNSKSFQTRVEKQFDYICKRAIKDERNDYFRYLNRISKYEVAFSMLDKDLVNNFSTTDTYSIDFTVFNINNEQIYVQNQKLAEALNELPFKKRVIILLYYFSELNDIQISKLLNLSRSTINEHRNNGLLLIKKKMKEYTDE
ncbi:TPA: RNA polymerase sigma factor [Listeria monocytogenes]